MGDQTRLRQIIVNLVNNAVKFTDKGEVVVSVRRVNPEDSRLWLEFRVSDSGIGIPEKNREHLFSPFQQADSSTTRKYGGTGLGLYICRNLVENMGGNITFENRSPRGTDFIFTIPANRVEKSTSAAIPPDFYSGLKVLVAEDNKEIRKILVNYLAAWGCSVTSRKKGL